MKTVFNSLLLFLAGTSLTFAQSLTPLTYLQAPLVEGLSYRETYIILKNYFELNWFLSADLFAGYETNLFQLSQVGGGGGNVGKGTPLTVFDPTFYAEIATHNYAEINLFNYAKFRIRLDFEGIRYNLLGMELVWDFNQPDKVLFQGKELVKKLCYGLSWKKRGLFFKASTELNMYECHFGLFGYIQSGFNGQDCEWRRYIPEQPIAQVSVTQLLGIEGLDEKGDYIDFICNDFQTSYDGGAIAQ